MEYITTAIFVYISFVLSNIVPRCGALSHDVARVQFFQDNQFSMLLLEQTLDTPACINLPNYIKGAAGSIHTQSCILIYIGTNCNDMSIKLDGLQQNGYYNLYEVKHREDEHFGRRVQSYMKCSSTEGGHLNHVDFYSSLTVFNDITYSYPDVCECMNLPVLSTSLGSLHKIDNHGNCVKLYTGSSCTGQSFEIKGGRSHNSDNVNQLASSIYSISPCGDYSSKCISLSAVVMRFVLKVDPLKFRMLTSNSKMAMTAKTVFRNNGSATVSQEYGARKNVKETHETFRITGSNSMHSINVAAGVQVEAEVGIPLIAKTKITASLSMAYTYEKSSSLEEGSRFVLEEEVEYSVNQKIEIPECSLYEVNSYVNLMENYPVNYALTFHVTGRFKNGGILSAAELKNNIGSLEYVTDYDENTIIARSYGEIVSSFGLEAVIDGEGTPINNCLGRQ